MICFGVNKRETARPTDRQTETKGDRLADRQTDRQKDRDRQTDRQTDRLTERQVESDYAVFTLPLTPSSGSILHNQNLAHLFVATVAASQQTAKHKTA